MLHINASISGFERMSGTSLLSSKKEPASCFCFAGGRSVLRQNHLLAYCLTWSSEKDDSLKVSNRSSNGACSYPTSLDVTRMGVDGYHSAKSSTSDLIRCLSDVSSSSSKPSKITINRPFN